MTEHYRKTTARSALANLAKALVGGASGALAAGGSPVLALVTKVFGDTVVDEVKARYSNDTTVQARAEQIRNKIAAEDIETLKKLILELAGIVPEDKTPIEALADAVADPDRIGEQELLRDAMMRLFDRAGRVSDEVQELAAGLETQINVQGTGAVGIRDIHTTGDVTIVTQVHTDHDAGVPSTAPCVLEPGEQQLDAHAPQIALAKLPSTSSDLFGRDEQLAALDEAWEAGTTNVVTLVAFGGVGKTALVNVWLGRMREDGFRGARRVYGWSFYSQGTSEDRQASGDEFLSAALKWFGVEEKDFPKSAWDRGERLAQLCRDNRTLLILDGLEPLQHPPGEETGKLRDPGVQSLLRELAVGNPGLCVVSTRIAVDDLKEFEDTSLQRMDLEDLSPQAGGQLLDKLGVKGPDDELEQAATDFGGHALALTLLGLYLVVVHDGDVRKRDEVPPLTVEARDGGHAKRVMACYERWFAGKPELCVLRMLGLFDRPAEGGAIEALRADPPIKHLTDALTGISDADWKFALKHLRDARLLAEPDAGAPDTLDCHPHVREHFGARLREDHEAAWREGHDRLFEYFRGPGCVKDLPETFEELAPLYAAVTHGCAAGHHEKAFHEVGYRRILRGEEYYSSRKLGMIGADLEAVSCFFLKPWRELAKGIGPPDQAFFLTAAGWCLRALGRLSESVQPTAAGLRASLRQEDWKHAAAAAGDLGDVQLALGNIALAVESARQAVELADRSADKLRRATKRAQLGAAFHQAGQNRDAEQQFCEAERLMVDQQPEVSLLTGLRGYQYCDFILDKGIFEDVLRRSKATLESLGDRYWLLGRALDHLSLGRAHLLAAVVRRKADFAEAHIHVHQAVLGLRQAGEQAYVPLGLLARAELCRVTKEFGKTQRDLDETTKIATRSGMRLFEADAHLEYARLHLAMGDKKQARASLAAGRKIVEETGYHRRDGAVKELEEQLG